MANNERFSWEYERLLLAEKRGFIYSCSYLYHKIWVIWRLPTLYLSIRRGAKLRVEKNGDEYWAWGDDVSILSVMSSCNTLIVL